MVESYVEEIGESLSYVKDIEGEIVIETDGFEILLTIDTADGEDELQEFL
jgi:hypothetical protein